MPLKYYCPKCSKRFVDWGAEKLGFKCPDCDGETLYRVGTQPEGEERAPTLSKRPAKKAAAKKAVAPKPKKEIVDLEPDSDDDIVIGDGDDDDDVLKDSLAIEEDD
tara:strand:+ start:136 stop:453 length:318 start_codon:yes stop_codon:yes gene_type:complete